MNALAINHDNASLALFDPLARVPAPIGDIDLRGRTGFCHTDLVTFLIRALAARYPVVRRLIGDDSFLQAARRFVAMQPPRMPIVAHFGEAFPHYLRSLGDAASFEYVADMAELEAARARAYHSADATLLDAQALSFLSTARCGDFVVRLHPSVAMVASLFPIVTIWKANQTDSAGIIDHWRAEAALVVRSFLDVDVLLLPPGGHAFMTALSSGSTIAAAAACATVNDNSFDLAATLTILAEANVVVGFHRRAAGKTIEPACAASLTPRLAPSRLTR
jgi:putative DNA-binding protein